MFKRLFTRKGPKSHKPSEPIYPGELFEFSEISDDNTFIGFSVVNKSYDNYPNKKYFPWCIQVTLELVEVDESEMPSENESQVLNQLEDKIQAFISVKHNTHFIGRITQNGFRDLIFYIDQPRFDHESTNTFFDQIQQKRKVNFNMEMDVDWNNVSGLLR